MPYNLASYDLGTVIDNLAEMKNLVTDRLQELTDRQEADDWTGNDDEIDYLRETVRDLAEILGVQF